MNEEEKHEHGRLFCSVPFVHPRLPDDFTVSDLQPDPSEERVRWTAGIDHGSEEGDRELLLVLRLREDQDPQIIRRIESRQEIGELLSLVRVAWWSDTAAIAAGLQRLGINLPDESEASARLDNQVRCPRSIELRDPSALQISQLAEDDLQDEGGAEPASVE